MYKVMPIGGEFKGKGHEDLARKLSDQEGMGGNSLRCFRSLSAGASASRRSRPTTPFFAD